MAEQAATVLVVPSTVEEYASGGKFLGKGVAHALSMDVDKLRNNLQSLLECIPEILPSWPVKSKEYKIDEIELAAEINAEGKFQFIGGVTAGATGGIKIKLTRSD